MNLDEQFEQVKPEEKRPSFLKVLCILTFIATGFGVLSGLLTLLSGAPSIEAQNKSIMELVKLTTDLKAQGAFGLSDMMENVIEIVKYTNAQYTLVQLTALIVSITGLIGAYFMWNGRKLGFHMYIIYCLLSSTSLYFFVPVQFIPAWATIFNLVFCGIFVFMYSRNLRWLTK